MVRSDSLTAFVARFVRLRYFLALAIHVNSILRGIRVPHLFRVWFRHGQYRAFLWGAKRAQWQTVAIQRKGAKSFREWAVRPAAGRIKRERGNYPRHRLSTSRSNSSATPRMG